MDEEQETPTVGVPEKKSPAIGVSILVLVVCGALVAYWWKTRTSQAHREVDKGATLSEEADRARRQAEEAAERERKRKDAESERARRKAEAEAERENRRLARENERKARQEQEKAKRENRERFEGLVGQFKSASIVFAADFADEKSPMKKDGTFFAIGTDYISDQNIYEATVEGGTVVAVRALSPNRGPEDMDARAFAERMLDDRFLVLDGEGVAWICGTGKSFWSGDVPLSGRAFIPAKDELHELFDVLSGWKRLPDLKYRLTLKPVGKSRTANGGKAIPLGVIGYAESLSMRQIRDAIEKALQEHRERTADIKRPKLKSFTPTVVFYDGDVVRKEMKLTKVPRRGGYSDGEGRRLRDEAERQERKLLRIQQENEELMYQYENKIRSLRAERFDDAQIEAEARKYVLLVERSRSRLATDSSSP